jgi:hypothetical protein
VRRDAEQRGFTLHIQATFGHSAAGGSTDDPRPRMISQKMPGDVARRLYAARDAGATQAQQEAILAEALRDEYFKDGGRRARGLDVELDDVAWMDVEGWNHPPARPVGSHARDDVPAQELPLGQAGLLPVPGLAQHPQRLGEHPVGAGGHVVHRVQLAAGPLGVLQRLRQHPQRLGGRVVHPGRPAVRLVRLFGPGVICHRCRR